MNTRAEREELETGYTTGTCAAATTRAALWSLAAEPPGREVPVDLPIGKTAHLEVSVESVKSRRARARTVKDAGDDPDVTDGATIHTEVRLREREGVDFEAGPGVGTMTLPGMPVGVGEPAINPVPRSMIESVVQSWRESTGRAEGVVVRVGVVDGEELAKRTLNPRLGIEDGLSILGTTGVVQPYSHASYIASIEQGIDVAVANGLEQLVASTGGRTEKIAMRHEDLPPLGFVQFGGFLKETLDYLTGVDLSRLSIYMMPGKFSKLVQGHLKLHSRDSRVDPEPIRAEIRDRFRLDESSRGTLDRLETTNQLLSALNPDQIKTLMGDWVKVGRDVIRRRFGDTLSIPRLKLVVMDREGRLLARERFSP